MAPSASRSPSTTTTRTTRPRCGASKRYAARLTQLYHPNLDLEGNVCLNILREEWNPILNLNSVLVGLQFLFLDPNPDDPLNKGTYLSARRTYTQRPPRICAATAPRLPTMSSARLRGVP